MNRALFTGRLPGTKNAAVDPLKGIFPQLPAFNTQFFPAMHGFTIDPDHCDERFRFEIQWIFHLVNPWINGFVFNRFS